MNNKLIKSVLLLSVAGLVTACDFEEKIPTPITVLLSNRDHCSPILR